MNTKKWKKRQKFISRDPLHSVMDFDNILVRFLISILLFRVGWNFIPTNDYWKSISSRWCSIEIVLEKRVWLIDFDDESLGNFSTSKNNFDYRKERKTIVSRELVEVQNIKWLISQCNHHNQHFWDYCFWFISTQHAHISIRLSITGNSRASVVIKIKITLEMMDHNTKETKQFWVYWGRDCVRPSYTRNYNFNQTSYRKA